MAMLLLVESILFFIAVELQNNRILGTWFHTVDLGVHLLKPVFGENNIFFFVLLLCFLGPFAISAFVEGQRYSARNAKTLSGLNLLSGSTAMALIGLGVFLALVILINFFAPGDPSLGELRFGFWDYYWIAAALVATTITSRIAFGIGLRQARKTQSAIGGVKK